MKKIWKNLCLCTLVLASAFCTACSCGGEVDVSKDLDGDGVISKWETIFESKETSTRDSNIEAEIIEISSFEELKAISETEDAKIYKLTRNIDCNGEEVAINLGRSTLFGNNKVIKNFKLGSVKMPDITGLQTSAEMKCLFYNDQIISTSGETLKGGIIYDLRVFAGMQEIDLTTTFLYTVISPFVNISLVDNIEIRGYINVKREKVDDLSANVLDISLCSANVTKLEYNAQGVSSKNITVDGKIDFVDEEDTLSTARIGVISPFVSKDSTIYNANVNVDMKILSGYTVYAGMIAGVNGVEYGENESIISTCSTSGTMNVSYLPCYKMNVGTIVGRNNRLADIKNCKTNVNVNFINELDFTFSMSPEIYMGGICGYNDSGVVEYVTSDAVFNMVDMKNLTIGEICGYSGNGIVSNVLSRGKIYCKDISNLMIANVVGQSEYGYMEKIVSNTAIEIDNSQITSDVKLGMLTIFEEFNVTSDTFRAAKSPNFKGILLSGSTEVYMKPDDSVNSFEYNLGLRNTYENPNKIIEDSSSSEDGESEIKYECDYPDMFSKVYYLNDFKLIKYNNVDGNKIQDSNISLTSNNNYLVSLKSDSSVYQKSFFISDIGFKFGGNHNEIDFGDFNINNMSFTLDEDSHLKGYFKNKLYNNELEYFDTCFNSICTYDFDDEMFSFLYYLIFTEQESAFTPIAVSDKFVTSIKNPVSSDESTGEETIITPSATLLKDTIAELLGLMDNVSGKIEALELSDSKEEISNESSIKYLKFSFSDESYQYSFMFDVSNLVRDGSNQNMYILYLKYTRATKI